MRSKCKSKGWGRRHASYSDPADAGLFDGTVNPRQASNPEPYSLNRQTHGPELQAQSSRLHPSAISTLKARGRGPKHCRGGSFPAICLLVRVVTSRLWIRVAICLLSQSRIYEVSSWGFFRFWAKVLGE